MTERAPAAPLYEAVVAALAEQGKSKRWLHQRSGVARTTLDAWQRQPKVPQAATVLAVADAVGLDRAEALRLGGVMDDASAIREAATADLSDVPTDALVSELHRIGDELRRRIAD